jgi:N-acetylmuramoyl-L-alanine amidase
MRDVNTIVIHTALTYDTMDIGAKEIDRWHRERGFSRIGYHVVIRRDGSVDWGRPLNEPGAHVQGHNAHTVGVVLAGGLDHYEKGSDPHLIWKVGDTVKGVFDANYTDAQWRTLFAVVVFLRDLYPEAEVVGHRDLAGDGRFCPGFDVKAWWANARLFGNITKAPTTLGTQKT